MNPFEEIHRTLDRVAALQEKSAKEFAEWRETSAKELAELQKTSARELAELRASIKRIGRKLGNIGMNNGYFVEELFYTSLRANPRLGDQTYDLVRRNIDDPNGDTEYDILLHNGESTAIIEVKYKARIPDIHNLLAKKAVAFRRGFGEYAHHKLYLGLASAVTDEVLLDEARRAGIFLLGQKGAHHEVINESVQSF